MAESFLFWIAIISISLFAEVLTAQLVSIWFVVGGIIALIVSLFTYSFALQIIIFFIVSLFMMILIRPLIKNIMNFKTQRTNLDRLIGKTAVVTKNIDNELGEGMVNVEGMTWSARSRDGNLIPKGETVEIDYISGVKLIVHNSDIK